MTRPNASAWRAALTVAALVGLAAGCAAGTHATEFHSTGSGPAPTTVPASAIAGALTPTTPIPATTAGAAATAGQLAAINTDVAQVDAASSQSDGDFDAGASAQNQSDSP